MASCFDDVSAKEAPMLAVHLAAAFPSSACRLSQSAQKPQASLQERFLISTVSTETTSDRLLRTALQTIKLLLV